MNISQHFPEKKRPKIGQESGAKGGARFGGGDERPIDGCDEGERDWSKVGRGGRTPYDTRSPPARQQVPRGKNLACNATSVLVNSTAGKMGFATAESVVMAGLDLVPVSFAAIEAKERISVENVPVDVYPIGERDEVIEEVKAKHPDLLVIDFTAGRRELER